MYVRTKKGKAENALALKGIITRSRIERMRADGDLKLLDMCDKSCRLHKVERDEHKYGKYIMVHLIGLYTTVTLKLFETTMVDEPENYALVEAYTDLNRDGQSYKLVMEPSPHNLSCFHVPFYLRIPFDNDEGETLITVDEITLAILVFMMSCQMQEYRELDARGKVRYGDNKTQDACEKARTRASIQQLADAKNEPGGALRKLLFGHNIRGKLQAYHPSRMYIANNARWTSPEITLEAHEVNTAAGAVYRISSLKTTCDAAYMLGLPEGWRGYLSEEVVIDYDDSDGDGLVSYYDFDQIKDLQCAAEEIDAYGQHLLGITEDQACDIAGLLACMKKRLDYRGSLVGKYHSIQKMKGLK